MLKLLYIERGLLRMYLKIVPSVQTSLSVEYLALLQRKVRAPWSLRIETVFENRRPF